MSALLREKRKGRESEFHPYIQALPRKITSGIMLEDEDTEKVSAEGFQTSRLRMFGKGYMQNRTLSAFLQTSDE